MLHGEYKNLSAAEKQKYRLSGSIGTARKQLHATGSAFGTVRPRDTRRRAQRRLNEALFDRSGGVAPEAFALKAAGITATTGFNLLDAETYKKAISFGEVAKKRGAAQRLTTEREKLQLMKNGGHPSVALHLRNSERPPVWKCLRHCCGNSCQFQRKAGCMFLSSWVQIQTTWQSSQGLHTQTNPGT